MAERHTSTWVLSGPPAAGKTTAIQGLVASCPGTVAINVWTAARALVAEDHPAARPLVGLVKGRDVFPDGVVRQVLDIWLSRITGPGINLIIDGYPRNVRQVEDLFWLGGRHHLDIVGLALLEVSDAVAEARALSRHACVACGTSDTASVLTCPRCGARMSPRVDDALPSLRARLADHAKVKAEIVPAFARVAPVHAIDASRSHAQILDDLRSLCWGSRIPWAGASVTAC